MLLPPDWRAEPYLMGVECRQKKDLDWNSMRICVGLVPDFWYDLADEHGLLFQNEWLYWQHHGCEPLACLILA